MVSTVTSYQHDVNKISTYSFRSKELSPSSVRLNTTRSTFSNHRWLIATLAVILLAGIIAAVGIIIVKFAIHLSITTTTTTSTTSTTTSTTTTTTTTTTTSFPMCFTAPSPQPSNTWYFVGNMSAPRYLHTSTFISYDNSILITGGFNGATGLSTTERYVPSTGCFRMSHGMSSIRYYHTADAMSSLSSWVIIAGGLNGVTASTTADIYDPITENIVTISLAYGVYAQSSTVLNGWQLILIGGVTTAGYTNYGQAYRVGSPSIFISSINTLPVPIVWHTATQLYNTSYLALVVGGTNGVSFYSTVSLYQGTSDTFISLSPGVSLSPGRAYHTATYLPYPINQVLIAGGTLNGATSLNTLTIFDVNMLQLVPIAASLVTARYFHTATLLPNGKILVIGGVNGISSSSCELIDPTNNYISTPVASLRVARHLHTATLISTSGNGTILVCGGYNTAIGPLNSCEIYVA